jgi:hypothetical protein
MSSLEFNISMEVDLKTALKVIWCASEKVFSDLPDNHPNTPKVLVLAKEKFFPMLDEMLKLDDPEDYEKFEEFDEICDKIADLINEISEDMKND